MQPPVLIFSLRPENVLPAIEGDAPSLYTNVRQLKKNLRGCTLGMLIIDIFPTDNLNVLEDLVGYVRQGMANHKIKIIALVNQESDLDKEQLFCQHDINQIFCCSQVSQPIYTTSIQRMLDDIIRDQQQGQRSEEQLQLLLSVNRFSHHRQALSDLIYEFSQTLHTFCHASLTLRVDVKQNAIHHLSHSCGETEPNAALLKQLQQHELPRLCQQMLELKAPRVELNISPSMGEILKRIPMDNCGCYLAFPLVVYDHLICFIVCFVQQQNMEYVSVSNVNNMKETAQQLRVLLERRSAENRLKSQYQRLKSTLAELQSTKEHLVHSEKMASVGQLAAGIAHEINNPLAYVLGNFAPLDNYVSSLSQVLEFHDQLMNHTSVTQNPDFEKLKQTLPNSEESDMQFMLEDLQAIVNDSRNGLLRVKDIINDLSSFSRKQPLELTEFDLSLLLDETLRLLKYELNDQVSIERIESIDAPVTAHRGFLQQILTNLIKNAAQAMESSQTDSPCIHIECKTLQSDMVISITDNGPGIAPELQAKVFDPFFTTKEVGKGTGLGLSVTYNLAEKMGGKLTLKSEKDTRAFVSCCHSHLD